MSSGMIRVSFSSMDAAADSIDQAAAKMAAQLNELQGYTNRATAAWEGSARDGYVNLQKDWDRTQDELTANLRKVATALRNSRTRFHTLEARSTSLMG